MFSCQRAGRQRCQRAPELPGSPDQALAQLQGRMVAALAVFKVGVVQKVELTRILIDDPHPR